MSFNKITINSILPLITIDFNKKDISDEERRSYMDILDRKSLQLKKLIEDLFEVSKTTSGNIKIKKNPVDLGELIRQAVTELQGGLPTHIISYKNRISS